MANGAHGQWGSWAMGNGAHGPMGNWDIFVHSIINTGWIHLPIPLYPIAHVTHCQCGPYPLYPIPPVPLLPMSPIPPVPPLPIGPMAIWVMGGNGVQGVWGTGGIGPWAIETFLPIASLILDGFLQKFN